MGFLGEEIMNDSWAALAIFGFMASPIIITVVYLIVASFAPWVKR